MSVPRETIPPGTAYISGAPAFRIVSDVERVVYGAPQAGWACGWCNDPRRHVHEFKVMPNQLLAAEELLVPSVAAPAQAGGGGSSYISSRPIMPGEVITVCVGPGGAGAKAEPWSATVARVMNEGWESCPACGAQRLKGNVCEACVQT